MQSGEGGFKYQLARYQLAKHSIIEFVGNLKPTFHEESTIVLVAVSLAIGIGLYFSAPYSLPSSFVIVVILCLLMLLLRFAYTNHTIRQSILYLVICCSGYLLADMRSDRISAAILPVVADYYSITGTVEARQSDAKGKERLILTGLDIEGMEVDAVPDKIRLQVRTAMNPDLAPGDRVRFDANLSAPQGPVAAGSFNFARNSWFDQIGGTGFAVSPIETVSMGDGGGQRLNSVRHEIGLRLSEGMSPKEAALATALLTGDRSGLPSNVVDEMRDAGLAHLLAISGLHMGLVTATIFFVIEALFALWPAVALRIPPAKIAAIVAWSGALVYLMLSGMGVSTIRAFMMVSIALIGILLDRRAISLRSISLAAITIMVVWPETLVSVGFQMSFAAVTGLVVFYENWGRKLMFGGFAKDGRKLNFGQKLGGVFIAAVMTTLVAELAIAPIALYHFQSVALYGLLANIIAVPLMSFLIMPLLLLTLLLMPLGLEWLTVPFVEPCLGFLMSVAAEVSALPGSTASIAVLPLSFLLVALTLGLMMTLMRGRLAYVLVPICLVAMIYFSNQTLEPDIYISKEGKVLAVKQESGMLAFDSRRHSYQKDAWRRMNGEGTDTSEPLSLLDYECDTDVCLYSVDRVDMPSIARVTSLEGLMSECGRSDIIIARDVSARYCKSSSLVIGFRMLDDGPISVWLKDGKIKEIKTVRESLGSKPWVPVSRF